MGKELEPVESSGAPTSQNASAISATKSKLGSWEAWSNWDTAKYGLTEVLSAIAPVDVPPQHVSSGASRTAPHTESESHRTHEEHTARLNARAQPTMSGSTPAPISSSGTSGILGNLLHGTPHMDVTGIPDHMDVSVGLDTTTLLALTATAGLVAYVLSN